MKYKMSKNNGFTLVELIVTILILGLLAGIAVPALVGYIDKSRQAQYIVEAREYKQTVTTLQVLVKGEAGKDLWDIERKNPSYITRSNFNFTTDNQYRVMNVSNDGTGSSGKYMWQQLTGKPYTDRWLADVRKGSAMGYFIIDRQSNIVAGWLISEDTNYVITWGVKQKTSTTFYDATNLVAPGGAGSSATLEPSDIDPSEGYKLYKRKPGEKVFYAA